MNEPESTPTKEEIQVTLRVVNDAAMSVTRALLAFVNAAGAMVEKFRYAKGQRKPKPRGQRAKNLSKALWTGYIAALREEKKNREKRMARVKLAPPLPADLRVNEGDEG